MAMAIKEMVFLLTILIFIFAVLLTIAVIAIAIWFQRIRKKIEAEIKAGGSKENEIVAKMTVKPRKKENKYSKNRKRGAGDREPEFYDSPPMRDDKHREIFQMKVFASHNVSSHAVTMPRSSKKEDYYIECIGDDKTLQRTTTFQGGKREYVTEVQQEYKSNATTSNMSRILQKDKIDGNSNREVDPQAEATLLIPPPLPIKKGHGNGIKGGFTDTFPQQQVSHNTSITSTNDHGEEMYEIMENNSETYENAEYVDDSHEDVYENQEIIEEEHKIRSQINMAQLPKHYRNWNSQAPNHYDDGYEEEVYENQEIVEQERRRCAQSDDSSQVELYENYVAEDMYENC